jgi:hypothetical protein
MLDRTTYTGHTTAGTIVVASLSTTVVTMTQITTAAAATAMGTGERHDKEH